MVGTAHIVDTLILLSFIRTGVDGGGDLTFAQRGYDITFPCEEDTVCFHMWKLSRSQSQNIAIISNGEIQRFKSEEKSCTLRMEHLTTEGVGRHRCHQRSNGLSTNTLISALELKLLPGKTVSLQCVLLSFMENRHCLTNREQEISLTWVDEANAEIQGDGQHRITQWSPCDVTLTVAFQSPERVKFRCQATVNGRVLTSVELWVRAAAPKGKGRGLVIEPENQGRNQDTIGAAVGVAGCVVLAAAVAVFVLNRRRTNNQLPDEPCSDEYSTINVMNTDDVIYAEIILPGGSDRVWVPDLESTEYSCVQYK
ncbi:uncharacterized protein LOC117758334 isoform X1 [Hippoglossus hippoglossus]|uniref:uncharacterized protein LOC117758334 isoform X1 n=2 Tax=Hippoglossus hippoglossus TaxID=8267 RepID=UPI00148CF900|nr:uncharacterized protein LOC117758334 isoform X1 [Hippoglossus hippoglossus]